MPLYVIGDLHLPSSRGKGMEKFGGRWQNHVEKLRSRWNAIVGEGDTVVIPGDFSWGMNLEECLGDFRFLDSLNGRKILLKGNHDYWWSSPAKIGAFFKENGIESVEILQNGAKSVDLGGDSVVVCGSRGWFVEERLQKQKQNSQTVADWGKMINRECLRLRLSLDEGMKLLGETCENANESGGSGGFTGSSGGEILLFMHFPPKFGEFVCPEIISVIREYPVKRVFFGHIHGKYAVPSYEDYGGLRFELASADFLDFYPKKVK